MEISKLNDVIILEKDKLALSYKYEDNAKFLNGITVCSYEYDLPKLLEKYAFYPYDKPSIGEIYIRNPFDESVFISIDSFQTYVIQEKSTCISDIVRLLGASSFHSEFEISSVKERVWSSDNKVTYKTVQADLSMKQECINRLNIKSETNMEYDVKAFSQEDFQKAICKVNKYKMQSNPDVRALLKQRDPQNPPLLKKANFSVSLSHEVNSSLDIAFKLVVMSGIFNLSSNFKSSVKERYELIETIDVIF